MIPTIRTSPEAEEIFDDHVVGRNVMAPTRLAVQFTTDGDIYELCEGTDFNRKHMWGVTVLEEQQDGGWKLNTDRSELFNEGPEWKRRELADDFIRTL